MRVIINHAAADGLSIISEDMSITVTKIAMTGVESNLDFGDQLFDYTGTQKNYMIFVR